ncbi:MAG: TIGR04255 family protein [Deltaproteobacteria bacterium]|nr:TIGR04255 family protein [Deltaproteobacteria bacterium]
MSKYATLKNAPIAEAVLEIMVQLKDGFEITNLKTIHDQIKERYPEIKERKYVKGGLDLHDKGKPILLPTTGGTDGFILRSPTEKKVIQTRVDGFAFNKLNPYENWSTFSKESRELWKLYLSIANPIKISRISLRYINRIEVPLPISDFSEFILTNPEIAPGLPQGVSNFFMRFEILKEDIPANAVIIVAMEQPTASNKLPLILDIDVICNHDYTNSMDKMWDDFEKLRNLKNEFFFKSITQKTRELFS